MKRIHQLVLSAILLLGAIVFGTVGLVHWRHDISENADISEYGMMPFYVSSFGYGTAVDDESDQNTDSMPVRYVEYRSEDGRFSFMQEVSENEYLDLQIARENQAEHRSVNRYVYTYTVDGQTHLITQEQELSDQQLREIIGKANSVSGIQYIVFAVILLTGSVYMLWMTFRRKKKTRKKTDTASASAQKIG